MSIQVISAQFLRDRILDGDIPDILDVRTDIECRTESLSCNVKRIPLHRLDAKNFVNQYANELKGRTLYILCRSGGRAKKAAEALVSAGLENVAVIEGGLGACASCGIPTRKESVMSLERQVRIAAGTLVLTGILLGHFVSWSFILLSVFAGGGLVFAGITDKCGMALLLARAPWNKDQTEDAIKKSIDEFSRKGA